MRLSTERIQELAPLTDADVVRRVLDGDKATFELLMRRHNQRLYRLARSILRNDSDAEDTVQETYVRAFTSLDRFRGEASVATWLSRICLHEALRLRRQRQRRPTTDMSEPEDRSSAPVERLQQEESQAILDDAIATLPVARRAVFMLRLVEGLGTRETAHSLRLSQSAVKVHLFRAKKQIMAALRRQNVGDIQALYHCAGKRCDRIVDGVFRRLSTR